MKTKVTKAEIHGLIKEAEAGEIGHETEITDDNFKTDITLLSVDVLNRPDLAGMTLRIFLNKFHKYVGHTLLAATPNRLRNLQEAGKTKGYVLPVEVARILEEEKQR